MLARLVENWLTNAGELGYQAPFAQLLATEGHRILQGPVHHPFEHGKDIITFSSDGELHAYQLKGPDLNLAGFERMQSQLLALAAAAVTHPAVSPSKRADRVFLVTNGVLTPPVRDRIEKFNLGNSALGTPSVEPIEREQLLSRFVAAHGSYLPQDPADMRHLLELYYGDGSGVFPVESFARFIDGVLPFPPSDASAAEYRRAAGSVALLTGYAVASWQRTQNHLGVAQAWLVLCLGLLRFAELRSLSFGQISTTYELALEAARAAVASLATEAAERDDLLMPDLVESVVYPSRALLVAGYLSAYFISESQLGARVNLRDQIRNVIVREAPYVRVVGEADTPLFYVLACGLELLGEIQQAEQMMLSFSRELARLNQPRSADALADPYHSTEDVLMYSLGADSELMDEDFSGNAYTLHIVIEWLARRLFRQHLAHLWPDVTRITMCEFRPSAPIQHLAVEDPDGEVVMWHMGMPHSWAALRKEALRFNGTELPDLIWERRELLPYLPLLFRHRFTSPVAKAIDHVGAGHCEIEVAGVDKQV